MKKGEKQKYKNNYAGVLHHILDLHGDGSFSNNQFWYAMDKVKEIIKVEQQSK